uniref:Uncharacterized protein n=1 Tax=Oryza meridionalis TaxID=40149 RepID=A0A0E0C0Y2_9ORYZ
MEGGGAGVEGVEEMAWSARGWEVDGGWWPDPRPSRRMATLLAAVRMGGNNFYNDRRRGVSTARQQRWWDLCREVRRRPSCTATSCLCLSSIGGVVVRWLCAEGARRVEVAGNDETLSHARVGRLRVKGLVLSGPLVTTLLGTVTLLGALS